MKRIAQLLLGVSLFLPVLSWQQSNDCSTATTLPVTANCSAPLNGTTIGATQSIAGCSGTADDDVWYQFTATATTHQINVTASATFDPVVQVFSGICSSLVSLACVDLGFAGENETAYLSGLTIGQVYRVRVYHYAAGSGSGTFTICCTVGAAVPANNNCAGAVSLSVNTSCVTTAGTTLGATQSLAGCSGTADDDVWYSFVATNATQTITVNPITSTFDAVFQVYSGSCGALVSEACIDNTYTNDPETSQLVGLTPGQTYYVRVYDYYTSNPGNFNICVTGPATATPTNDNPCSAITLPPVTSNCNYLEFTTVGATNTATPGAPSSCIGGSGAAQGGFSAGTLDVWFAIVVPASGNLHITPKPNMGTGRISDGVMVLYSGTCSALTQITCSDDNNFPGTANDLLPFISASGLTPGSTVYLRFFGYGTSSGTFGLCVTTATNDACSNALYICDLNGYSASTSAAFTPDRPCNMRGNAEQNNPPSYTYTPGTDQGGIFGSGGAWGTGTTPDVRIDNNSWIRFTAAATTAVLSVTVSDCWVGNYPSGGIQMQIFSSNGSCCNFTPVSNFEENSTSFTITANNLTPGQDYYLMVDGFAGDICNYTITAQSGVQFPEITPVPPICSGSSVTLTAPNGASSYSWFHNGASSQSVTVSPATTQNFSVDVYGICGYKQTLTTTVVVNPIPNPPTLNNNQTVCNGATLNLTASTVSGATYSWTGPNGFVSSQQNPSISNVTAAAAGTYNCTITVNGCTSPAASTVVTINPIPSAPVISSNTPVCVGQTIALNSNTISSATYNWSGPSGFSSNLEDPTRTNAIAGYAGTYSMYVTVGGCNSAPATTNVVVNPIPAAPTAGSNSPVCSGNTIALTATNVSGASGYTWSGPNSYSSNLQNPTIASSTTGMSGTYSVTATVNGCVSNAATVNVTINATPATPAPATNGPVCQGQTVNLSQAAVGSATYSWTGPNSFSSSLQNPSFGNAQAINAGTYSLTVTVNGCTSAIGTTALTVNTAATVDAGANLASCNGAAVNLAGLFGGSASSVTWSNGTGSFSNINSATSSYTPSGTEITNGSVTLILTTNDPAGACPAVSDNVVISISSSPSAAFSYPNPEYCQSSLDPSPVFPIGSSGGTFSSSAGLSISPSTGAIDVSASTPGTYTVNNNIAANGSCPSANASTTFEVVATPATPSANNNGLICDQGTISLSTPTTSGATYSWTGPNGFNSTDQNPSISSASSANAGTYSVVVTADGCPSANGTTNVNITPNPSVSIINGASTAVCTSESVVLTASGADSYVWSTTETTDNISVAPTTATVYTVTGTTNGCSSNDVITVNINTPPTLSAAPSSTNSNCDTPTGSLTGIVINGTPNFDYLWTDNNANNVGVTADLTNVSAGDYFVNVTDGNGCSADFGPFTINNFPTPATPNVTFDNASPCVDGSATGSTTTVSGATYSWTGPNGFSSTANSFTIDPVQLSNSGAYCVTLNVNGCAGTPGCENLTVNTVPNVTVNAVNQDTSACVDETIQLQASGAASYQWTGPNSFNAATATVSFPATSAAQTGYYIVTGTSGQNCTASDSVLITVHPLPALALSSNGQANNSFCSGASIQLSATGTGNIVWSGPNNFNAAGNTITISPASATQSGVYTALLTDNNGCSVQDTLAIQVQNSDFGGVNGEDELCSGQTLQLAASGGESYSWSGPNMFTSSNANISVPGMNNTTAGFYIVEITDSLGCTTQDTIDVSIVITPDCLKIPELVTPDGNGQNDTWDIEGLSYFPEAEVFIYNRWGSLIYKVSPYTTPWNGEINEGLSVDGKGGKVPVSTYFYLIRLHDAEETEYKGYLELQY